MVEKNWKLVEEEPLVSFINKREEEACRSRFVTSCIVLLVVLFVVLRMIYSTKQSDIGALTDKYSNRDFYSGRLYAVQSLAGTQRAELENELAKESAYRKERKQMDAIYQKIYVAVVVLYIFSCLINFYHYFKTVSLKDKRFFYIKGAVSEREMCELKSEHENYSNHQVSIRLDNGEIVGKIRVESVERIELGERIVVVREQGSQRLPKIYLERLIVRPRKSTS